MPTVRHFVLHTILSSVDLTNLGNLSALLALLIFVDVLSFAHPQPGRRRKK